jgi:hypothetical protein
MHVTIPPIEARDRAAREPLWDGYIRFSEGQENKRQPLAGPAIAD